MVLLSKWSWRYGNEKGSLWRAIVDQKVRGDPLALLMNSMNNENYFILWNNIINPLFLTNKFFM